ATAGRQQRGRGESHRRGQESAAADVAGDQLGPQPFDLIKLRADGAPPGSVHDFPFGDWVVPAPASDRSAAGPAADAASRRGRTSEESACRDRPSSRSVALIKESSSGVATPICLATAW